MAKFSLMSKYEEPESDTHIKAGNQRGDLVYITQEVEIVFQSLEEDVKYYKETMNFIRRTIIKYLIKEVAKMRFLKGYITYIAAALMIIIGVLQITGLVPDFIQTSVQGLDLIMAGLAVFGIGRKVQAIVDK